MPLQPGDRVGSYEILSTLGAGGMGVVYRARDTRLGREVAIKTLPEGFAADPERVARFEREARVLAALNHANVATVYGFERADDAHFLTMELVEGETLEDRIARGPIPSAQALPLFIQIAEGLEAAHAKGIVHRDLKPANVKVGARGSSQMKAGAVKILDFGLAKALAPDDEARSASVSHSPTLTLQATMRGEILGTAAYMSPEQAQGLPADHRADVWAFGVCLLEALTSRRVFDGANHSFVLASVLKDEPNYDALPAPTPPQVRRLLRRCLEKNRDRRLHDIADARLELEEALVSPAGEREGVVAITSRPSRLWIAVATAAGLALGAAGSLLVARLTRSEPKAAPPTRFVLNAPPNEPVAAIPGPHLAISPDGRSVVYVTGVLSSTALRVQRLDQLQGEELEGVGTDVFMPFFSPDGKWVGYLDRKGSLRRVSILGGPSVTLLESEERFPGASWGTDGSIVLGRERGSLVRVPAEGGGGEPQEVAKLEEGEVSQRYPEVLPSGNAILYASFRGDDREDSVLKVLSLDSGERKVVAPGGTFARFVPPGHLLYAVGGTLLAVAFDPRRLEVIGDPVPIVQDIETSARGAAKLAVSAEGTLAYVTGASEDPANVLVWVDRAGQEEALGAPPRLYVYPRLSPDGKRIALDVRAQEEDIWIWEIERETLTRLTFSPGVDAGPVWSPDGRMVYFGSAQDDGGWDIFGRLADGTGAPIRLTEEPGFEAPASIMADGATLVAIQGTGDTGPYDIVRVGITGSTEPETLLQADFNLGNAELSPDGRWLAYESDESGAPEVFVRPFPALESGRWQVSTRGGTRPLWSPDGAEIFFLDDRESLKAATVDRRGEVPVFGRPETVIEKPYLHLRTGRTYDVSRDGRRFLFIKTNEEEGKQKLARQIVVVQNFADELQRLAPTDR